MSEQFESLPAVRKIDEQKEGSFSDNPEERAEPTDEIKKYQEDGQKMIDSYRRFFATFAKDVSLSFKMSNGFYIDLEKGEVNLDTKWFAEKEFSSEQILWANLHELSHFRDLAEDPKQMMENFEYIRVQAKKTGALILQKWTEKYGASDPEFVENLKKQRPMSKKDSSKTMNAVEQAAYQIHHTFYNIFDDIYVNNLVARKAATYEKGTRGGNEVEKLYREKLFAQTDYTKLPRHMQFIYQLIREEMVADEKVVVSDEVESALQGKIKFMGSEYSAQEIVENFIKPKKNRDTLAGQRYYVLQQTLEPIFQELLRKDLDDWNPEKPEKQNGQSQGEGDGAGNPFDQDYQEQEKNNPDQISPEDIEDWMKKNDQDKKKAEQKKAQGETDENKSVEEKAKESQDKLDADWCGKNNVNSETLKQFRKIEAEVAPYLADLSKLWQKIIFGSTRKIEREMDGHFKSGTDLDIQKTVEQWPDIQKGNFDEARIFKKMTQKEILIQKPELIRVRLAGDMSGSMNSEKIHILQQCFVLLLSSLQEFNSYLNFERTRTKSKLEVDTEAWIFGDSAECVKKLRSDSGYGEEKAGIVRIFEKLQRTIGGTYDNKALEAISENISADDKARIEQGKIMEIVFEITDGGSSDERSARMAVDRLLGSGMIARAFQIGSVSESEKEVFNKVWNNNRAEGLGEIVGENIANLLPAITEVLKKYLSNVKL